MQLFLRNKMMVIFSIIILFFLLWILNPIDFWLHTFPRSMVTLALVYMFCNQHWSCSPPFKGAFFKQFLQELFLYSSFLFIFKKQLLRLFLSWVQLLFSFKILDDWLLFRLKTLINHFEEIFLSHFLGLFKMILLKSWNLNLK